MQLINMTIYLHDNDSNTKLYMALKGKSEEHQREFWRTGQLCNWLIIDGDRKITKVPVTITGLWIYIYIYYVPWVINNAINLQRCHLIVLLSLNYSTTNPVKHNYFYYKHNYVFTQICYMFWQIRSQSAETVTNIYKMKLTSVLSYLL